MSAAQLDAAAQRAAAKQAAKVPCCFICCLLSQATAKAREVADNAKPR